MFVFCFLLLRYFVDFCCCWHWSAIILVNGWIDPHKKKGPENKAYFKIIMAQTGSKTNGTNAPPATATTAQVAVVCCSCFGRKQKPPPKPRRLPSMVSNMDAFEDAHSCVGSVQFSDADSMYFFDATPDPLGDEEYPIVVSMDKPPPKAYVSLDEPETLLAGSFIQEEEDKEQEPRMLSREVAHSSVRLEGLVRRPTHEQQHMLEHPPVKIAMKGYPGGLTIQELNICQQFIRELKQRHPLVAAQVYSFRKVEDAPYALCRWLRATKFHLKEILQRLEDNKNQFAAAQAHDFYPNPSDALGCPVGVFLTQYPFLPIGRARNGCPVNYFQAGKIQPEGILCLTDLPHMEAYFWYQFMHKFQKEMMEAKQLDPNFCRAEGINILDLSGLNSSVLKGDTMAVIQLASKIADFFPETLHCMLLLNVPSFFAMFWSVIQKFIDPRTAQRIQVFSNKEKGLKRLHELIDASEIPQEYGGTGPCVNQVLLQASASAASPGQAPLKRQVVHLMHLKKKGHHHVKEYNIDLEPGETLKIHIYSRSAAWGKFTIHRAHEHHRDPPKKIVHARGEQVGETWKPRKEQVDESYAGPGTINIHGILVDGQPGATQQPPPPKGYFLIVGEIV